MSSINPRVSMHLVYGSLPNEQKVACLETLGVDRLRATLDALELEAPDRRSRSALVTALSGAPLADLLRALKVPALVALGMRDRGAGWDVEMLVRATKLGLTSDEVGLPAEEGTGRTKVGSRALLHILRHATMR